MATLILTIINCEISAFFCEHYEKFQLLKLWWIWFFAATRHVVNLGPNSAELLAETQTYDLRSSFQRTPQVQVVPIQQQSQTGQAQQQPMVVIQGQSVVMGQAQQQPMAVVQPIAVVQPTEMGQAQQQPMQDPLQKITQLKGLLDAGAITQAEFDAKKAEQLSLI